MDHVAALTKTAQVAQPVVGRIMIEVRGGEHDAGRPQPGHVFQVGLAPAASALEADTVTRPSRAIVGNGLQRHALDAFIYGRWLQAGSGEARMRLSLLRLLRSLRPLLARPPLEWAEGARVDALEAMELA